MPPRPRKKDATRGDPVRKSSRVLEKKQKEAIKTTSQPDPPQNNLKRALPTELLDEIISYAASYSTELDVSESCFPALRGLNVDVPLVEVKRKEQERLEALQTRRKIMTVGKRWSALGRKWLYRTLVISDHSRQMVPTLLGHFLATNEGQWVRRVDVVCEITPETIEGAGTMIRGLIQCCPNVVVLHERVKRKGWKRPTLNEIPKQASFEIPFAMALGNRKYQTVQLASFTSDALYALGYKYSIDMLWRLPHIRVLSLNDFTGWNQIPDNISLDPRPPKFYKMDPRKSRQEELERQEKQRLAEERKKKRLEQRQQKKKREWTPGEDGRKDRDRVRQSPIPSDKSSTITDSSDLMEDEDGDNPHPEIEETDIPQTRVSKSAWAQKDQGGEPQEHHAGGGEIPDSPSTTEEGDEDGADDEDGSNEGGSDHTELLSGHEDNNEYGEEEEEEEEGTSEEETSEEEEEEIIYTLSFPDLHTLDMTLPFVNHFPTAEVYKYVGFWDIPRVTQLAISIPTDATFPDEIFKKLGDQLTVLSLKRLGARMTGIAPVALPRVEHLIVCVRGCHRRWDTMFVMKEVRTVTLYTANLNLYGATDARLEPQELAESDGEQEPPHWKLWLTKLMWVKCALDGCVDVAGSPALTRVVMQGFPFVEIAGCGREDVVRLYEGYFGELRGRGVTVDGQEGISWEDAKEKATRRAHEEAVLAAERAAVEAQAQAAMDVDGLPADATDSTEVHG